MPMYLQGKTIDMIITSKTPKLDLHGEKLLMVEALVNSFINDNYLLKNDTVIIIHGKNLSKPN